MLFVCLFLETRSPEMGQLTATMGLRLTAMTSLPPVSERWDHRGDPLCLSTGLFWFTLLTRQGSVLPMLTFPEGQALFWVLEDKTNPNPASCRLHT